MNRALSKLGILSRAQATEAIRAGRVKVNGRVVTNPAADVVPERAGITIDGERRHRAAWRTILFYKPRGVVTTREDPEGRATVYDVIGPSARGLIAVGRLDLATSGLLLLTTDTRLAQRLTDPGNAVPRVYLVTVRGRVTDEEVATLEAISQTQGPVPRASAREPAFAKATARSRRSASRGGGSGWGSPRGEAPRVKNAASVIVRKASNRETHLTVELHRGRNREVRKLFEAIGHEVTTLKRVRLGGLELGHLAPGEWKELTRTEVETAFPRGI